MVKNKCNTCWNNHNGFCTCLRDMEEAGFKQCPMWKKKEIKKVGKIKQEKDIKELRSVREERILSKIDVGSKFQNFLEKGGGYSFRTGEYI